MKILLRRNVTNLGKIGEVVDVKPGYARNYLLPQMLAIQPTEANIRQVEREKEDYLKELAKLRKELQAKADVIEGKEITIPARANPEGHLYGSVGPAQIVAALAEVEAYVEPNNVLIPENIQQVGKYDVPVRFDDEVQANVIVTVQAVDDMGQPIPLREEAAGAEEPIAADDIQTEQEDIEQPEPEA
ncbi:MAG: 50S ribosomal protein L9 [Phycisphaerae bacterium]